MKANAIRIMLATIASVFLCIAIAFAQQTVEKEVKSDNGTTWIFVEGGPTGDFFIAATEVTFDQFDRFCEATGYKNPEPQFGRGKHPVSNVNVADAVAYCGWLSRKTGTTVRLPEENEWVYAAKGGKKSRGYEYSGSDNVAEVAWYEKNSDKQTHEAGTKNSNELGIFDMSGNVWEWCGSSGSLRGGSWNLPDYSCHISRRRILNPRIRSNYYGFRPLQTR